MTLPRVWTKHDLTVRCDCCRFWQDAAVGTIARPLDGSTLEEKQTTSLGGLIFRPKLRQCKADLLHGAAVLSDTSGLGTPMLFTQAHFGCNLFEPREKSYDNTD